MSNTLISKILWCPYCNGTKQVAFSKTPWYHADVQFWSDGRTKSDTWREPASVQICPHCVKYFILSRDIKTIEYERPCSDTGQLPYNKQKEALAELSDGSDNEAAVRMALWHAYNDLYDGMADTEIQREEQQLNHLNMEWLLTYYRQKEPLFSYTSFELSRLLGRTDECKRMIDSLTFQAYEDRKKSKYNISDINIEVEYKLYDSIIANLKDALQKPLRPYLKK
ncbi:MAG: hypothetical protein IJP50_02985 [Paludibacteraceae bacterium]|nr:hypothetical protein [Paludibacteraceae bacterium]